CLPSFRRTLQRKNMMAANYRHIGGGENRLGRHYSRFSGIWPTSSLADQSLTPKSQNAGSNRPSRASTGLLHPGDRVDVILTQTFKNDAPLTRRSVSETVVESLRVLAIDAPDAKPANGGSSFGRTVTLEMTPEQAEKINVAAELGKLSLALRGVN